MYLGSRSWHSLGHRQQLCEIISKSNMTVVSYGRDKGYTYVCIRNHCDLDLRDMTLIQGDGKPLVMDNNCVKYYPNPTWQKRVIAHNVFMHKKFNLVHNFWTSEENISHMQYYWQGLLTLKFDLFFKNFHLGLNFCIYHYCYVGFSYSHNCCLWPKVVLWPWLKVADLRPMSL